MWTRSCSGRSVVLTSHAQCFLRAHDFCWEATGCFGRGSSWQGRVCMKDGRSGVTELLQEGGLTSHFCKPETLNLASNSPDPYSRKPNPDNEDTHGQRWQTQKRHAEELNKAIFVAVVLVMHSAMLLRGTIPPLLKDFFPACTRPELKVPAVTGTRLKMGLGTKSCNPPERGPCKTP